MAGAARVCGAGVALLWLCVLLLLSGCVGAQAQGGAEGEAEGGTAAAAGRDAASAEAAMRTLAEVKEQLTCGPAVRYPPEPLVRSKLKHLRCLRKYQDNPKVAFLLANPQSLATAGHVKRAYRRAEIIALFWDASPDKAYAKRIEQWKKALNGENDFMIYTKQPLEPTVAIDRMLRMTNANTIVVITDESQAPLLSGGAVRYANMLFSRLPRLGLVGVYGRHSDATAIVGSELEPLASANGLKFRFATEAVGGPFFVRRDAYMHAGVVQRGMDECQYACKDAAAVLSWRMWSVGYQVGVGGMFDISAMPVLPNDLPTICTPLEDPKTHAMMLRWLAAGNEVLRVQGTAATEAMHAVFGPGCERLPSCVRKVPPLAAIVQYFNRKEEVKRLAKTLSRPGKDSVEIVINDDSLSQTSEWLTVLKDNDFLVLGHNLHEIRGYERLIRFTGSPYVGLMQDDDAPKKTAWAFNVPKIFEAYPKLGMIGAFRGRLDTGNNFDKTTGQLMGKKFGPRFTKLKTHDPVTGVPFMFMYKVNVGPLFLRRNVFLEVGGFNRNFSCPGASGIDFDFEYSIRLWKHEYQVALADLGFDHGAEHKSSGGTRANDKVWEARRNTERLNNAELYAMFRGFHHKVGTKKAMAAAGELAAKRKELEGQGHAKERGPDTEHGTGKSEEGDDEEEQAPPLRRERPRRGWLG